MLRRMHKVQARILAFLCLAVTAGRADTKPDLGPSTESSVAYLFTAKPDPRSDDNHRARLSRVNDQIYGSYMKGYPTFSKVPSGQSIVKVICYIQKRHAEFLTTFKIVTAKLEAGHYYELVCDRESARVVDHGADTATFADLLPKSKE